MEFTGEKIGSLSIYTKRVEDNLSAILGGVGIKALLVLAIILAILSPLNSWAEDDIPTQVLVEPNTATSSMPIQFNSRELAWMQIHKKIKIGTSQYPPLSYMDNSGSIAGISADFLSLISEKTGLRFEIEKLDWLELMKQSKNRGIDLFSGLKNPERDKYLNFTSPYLNVSYVVINRVDMPFLSSFHNLNGRKVSVVNDWAVHKLLKNTFPNVVVMPYDNLKKAIRAVSTGEVEAYVGDLFTASYEIQESVLTNLKVASAAPFKDDFVRFAVRKDWPELTTILEKVIQSISREQRGAILNKWLQVKYEKGVDYSLVWKWTGAVASFAALIIIIISMWNRNLKREISLRQNVASDLQRAKNIAEGANKSKSEFLANMSHEIRTPLNGALSMAKLLEGTALNRVQRQYVDAITFSGQSLLLLINDILDISKIEAGKLPLEITAFELKPIIDGIIKLLAIKTKEQSNYITSYIDQSVPAILVGDAAHLRQILFNLIGNAIKFTKGGEISIEVVRNTNTDNTDNVVVLFKVIDNGIGIPKTVQSQVFDVFTQADSSTSRLYGGSGLGLSICHRLVALMSGKIGFDSREGLGSTFWFELPLSSAEAISLVEGDKDSSGFSFCPLNILLVEDDLVNQIAESALLQQEGHQVTIADDGYVALEILTSYLNNDAEPFDLILVDIRMPGMSGQETTVCIRQMPTPIGTLPIIALTADVTVENISECYAAGIDKVLSKPINLQKLSQELRAISKSIDRNKPSLSQ